VSRPRSDTSSTSNAILSVTVRDAPDQTGADRDATVSLTRCTFLIDDGAIALGDAKRPGRRVYEGRLHELHQAMLVLKTSADKEDRPRKGARAPPEP
jgi:hypothetical protein